MLAAAFIAGMAFLVCGTLWLSRRSAAKAMDATARFTVSELGGIPLDGNVEVVGNTRVHQQPLAGPMSNTPGVWWRVKVTEHWTERDSDGDTQRRSRVISDTTSPNFFFIEDHTGSVAVLPDQVDMLELERSYYQKDNVAQLNLGFLGTLNVTSGRWTETEEWVLPADAQVLALAHAGQDQNGTRFLHKGSGNHSPFIALTDNPEQFAGRTKRSAKLWGWGAVISLAVAAGCAAAGLL